MIYIDWLVETAEERGVVKEFYACFEETLVDPLRCGSHWTYKEFITPSWMHGVATPPWAANEELPQNPEKECVSTLENIMMSPEFPMLKAGIVIRSLILALEILAYTGEINPWLDQLRN